jgi:hypothetical protein
MPALRARGPLIRLQAFRERQTENANAAVQTAREIHAQILTASLLFTARFIRNEVPSAHALGYFLAPLRG